MNKKSKTKPKKEVTFKKRQAEFIKRINKVGEDLKIAVVAKLEFTEDGILPKVFLTDVSKKK